MTPRCKISPETLTALYESALPWWQKLALTPHTRRCEHCQATLANLGKLDTQLRSLAPIPAEITQFFHQKHRRLLIGSSLALAIVGAGTWRFFTPEIEWADVEKELAHTKILRWKRVSSQISGSFLDSPLEWIIKKTDPNLKPTPPINYTLFYKYTINRPREIFYYNKSGDPGRATIKYDYLFTNRTRNIKPNKRVIISNGHRVIAFQSQPKDILRSSKETNIFTTNITFLVDPKTRHIIQGMYITKANGQTTNYILDTDFQYDDRVSHFPFHERPLPPPTSRR